MFRAYPLLVGDVSTAVTLSQKKRNEDDVEVKNGNMDK
jgi:hypothetical protein